MRVCENCYVVSALTSALTFRVLWFDPRGVGFGIGDVRGSAV